MSRLFPWRVLCVLCGLGQIACGQKGPPLAPIVYLPRAVTELTAKRVENDVVLEFKVATANTDSTSPADLARVEVYGHTGPLPTPADFPTYGTLVRSIEVKPPDTGASGATGAGATGALIEQGGVTLVRESLTEKHMEPGLMPPTRAVPLVDAKLIETLETPETVNFPSPVLRYYTVVGVSRSRHRRGPYAGPIRVPLVPPLEAPHRADATYTADAISLTWLGQPEDSEPAPAVAPPLPAAAAENSNQETSGTYEIYADIETAGTEDAPLAAAAARPPQTVPPRTPRFGYNVYESPAPNASDAPVASNAPVASIAPVRPLNTALLTVPRFSDARVEFGTERCYVVRRVEMVSAIPIESAPSPPVCVTPVDTFPPAAPKMLVSVASGSAVSLIWEASTEVDLGGYLVLRGEAPGDTLAPLTAAPISDAAYVDTSIRRGRTYVYEVVAVDKAGNQSGPSNRIEEAIQ